MAGEDATAFRTRLLTGGGEAAVPNSMTLSRASRTGCGKLATPRPACVPESEGSGENPPSRSNEHSSNIVCNCAAAFPPLDTSATDPLAGKAAEAAVAAGGTGALLTPNKELGVEVDEDMGSGEGVGAAASLNPMLGWLELLPRGRLVVLTRG